MQKDILLVIDIGYFIWLAIIFIYHRGNHINGHEIITLRLKHCLHKLVINQHENFLDVLMLGLRSSLSFTTVTAYKVQQRYTQLGFQRSRVKVS